MISLLWPNIIDIRLELSDLFIIVSRVHFYGPPSSYMNTFIHQRRRNYLKMKINDDK